MKTIKRLIIITVVIVSALYAHSTYEDYKFQKQCMAAIHLIELFNDDELVGLMVQKPLLYKAIADKVDMFEPTNGDEKLRKVEAMKKMLRCLEDAVVILKQMEEDFGVGTEAPSEV